MPSRRWFLQRSTAIVLGLAGGPLLARRAAGVCGGTLRSGARDAPETLLTPAAERAVVRGLSYLSNGQDRDGAFGTRAYRGNVAVTSLGGLAMVAGGHLPGSGPHGGSVARALAFVLGQEDATVRGYLHNPKSTAHGPMYGQGFGTLLLAKLHGSLRAAAQADRLRDLLTRAVALIVRSQNPQGGWRYLPTSQDADLSVTVCQLQALRAAREAGLAIPKRVGERAILFVRRCQDRTSGGFRYMLQGGGKPEFARTAAAVAALLSAGMFRTPEVEKGLAYLMKFKPGQSGAPARPNLSFFFYGHYYAAQATWAAGGTARSEWYPAIREALLGLQRADGSWTDPLCPHYATAMACIILQLPRNFWMFSPGGV